MPRSVITVAASSDAKRCFDFHNSHSHHGYTFEQWLWAMANEVGVSETLPILIAELDNRIVGIQLVVPVSFVDTGGRFTAARLGEEIFDDAKVDSAFKMAFRRAVRLETEGAGHRYLWRMEEAIGSADTEKPLDCSVHLIDAKRFSLGGKRIRVMNNLASRLTSEFALLANRASHSEIRI